jgi:hypothetical protein
MDQLYRNIKTGATKRFPPKVYDAVRTKWQPIPEPVEKPVVTDPEEKQNIQILEKITKEPLTQEIEDQTADTAETSGDTKSKEQLQAEYEALAGKKPDGRWSEKKLAESIQELKETNK